MSEEKKLKIESLLSKLKSKAPIPPPVILAEMLLVENDGNIIHVGSLNSFLRQVGRSYSMATDEVLENSVFKMLKKYIPGKYFMVKPHEIENTIKSLRHVCPTQIKEEELAHGYIAFNDCLYNTETHEREPHNPKVFCYKRIDVSTEDFSKPKPHFNKYLETTLVNQENVFDPTLSELYQEMWGALLSGRMDLNRAFFLFGSGANGKSITTELMASMSDPEFLCSANLESLTKPFGKSQLVGKIANICSEEESRYLAHDTFKVLITGELTGCERKFKNPGTFRNRAKFIFSSNNLPTFKNMDKAIKRRIIIIPFNRTFSDKERDYGLLEKLRSEKAQIIGYALEGLKRLQKNNRQYTESFASQEAIDELEASSNNVLAFFNEEVEVDMKHPATKAVVIYERYKEWCEETKHKACSRDSFSRRFAKLGKVKKYKSRPSGTNKYHLKLINEDVLPPVIERPYVD